MSPSFTFGAAVLLASALAVGSTQSLPADACLDDPSLSFCGVALLQVEAKLLPWPASWPAFRWPWSPQPQDVTEESEVQDIEQPEAPIIASGAQEVNVAPEQDVVEAPDVQEVVEESQVLGISDEPTLEEVFNMPSTQDADGFGALEKILASSLPEDTHLPKTLEDIHAPEEQKVFGSPKEEIIYAQFDNYCVSQMGAALMRDGGHSTPGGTADCKAVCNADEGCSGFEWYQAG
eukprot:CAMPEP_0170611146 /NCGR_PEP_ID=MMETSP0224-20130122/23035_1 /TAXON_ID=285029 /ORGANISM="Togula jolla, Strain CCCM 725" /LENGTH=233 /DNA_ID=CAMNT_0010936565 /DNA_START=42 /DNA_END=740 /DNA_ORIENTATION=+